MELQAKQRLQAWHSSNPSSQWYVIHKKTGKPLGSYGTGSKARSDAESHARQDPNRKATMGWVKDGKFVEDPEWKAERKGRMFDTRKNA